MFERQQHKKKVRKMGFAARSTQIFKSKVKYSRKQKHKGEFNP